MKKKSCWGGGELTKNLCHIMVFKYIKRLNQNIEKYDF